VASASTPVPAPERTPEQQLAWEAERRVFATVAAALAGVFTLAGAVVAQVSLANFPQVGLLQALTPALTGHTRPATDPHRPAMVFLDNHAAQLILSAALGAIGTIAAAYVLYYLYEAVKARRPDVPPFVRYTAVAAPVLVAILSVARQIASSIETHNYLSNPDGTKHALDAVNGGAAAPLGYIGLLAQLALVATIIVLALNAMRVGLLTRFMGVLGIIAAVLFILPIFGTLPVIQALWLIALAPLFAGRWPNGLPPAWVTGRAEPWPSQQQIREQREAARNRAEAQAIKDAPASSERGEVVEGPDGAEPIAPQRPRSNRRKRRKR
jgi:hypothetical protein